MDVCAHWLQESWNDSKILFVTERLFKNPYSWSRWQAFFLSALLSSLCIQFFFFGGGGVGGGAYPNLRSTVMHKHVLNDEKSIQNCLLFS